MDNFKDQLLAIWISFTEAVIRFWNNRSIRVSDEVHYLRLQLEKAREDNVQLIETIKVMVFREPNESEPIQQTEHEPIKYRENWHTRRARLEQASRNEAIRLDREARVAIEREKSKDKTIEQLEDELLHGTDGA